MVLSRYLWLILGAGVLVSVAGCGGGSSSGTGTVPPAEPPIDEPTPPPEPPVDQALSYPLFEAGPVRPLALSPDGTRLFAVNIPAHRLEIFRREGAALVPVAHVPVGLEPVAVAAPSNDEVWVVNHLSDSVSVVDVAAEVPFVKRTLWVGDEPRDIVFAGENGRRAFISSARRGQNHVHDPAFTTPGVGRASVWVFDADNLGTSPGGTPETVLTLFGNTPRGLATSPDGRTVYAAILHSGNRTTTLPADALVKSGPETDSAGAPAPDTGLIVRHDGSAWRDAEGNDWSDRVRFNLPDQDVFAIDAMADTPSVSRQWSGVGTTLFNLAVNPASGEVYVSNLEARNEVRFEGSGERGSSVRGHFIENRITVLDDEAVLPRHLNRHLDYSRELGTPEENAASLATPLDMAVTADGEQLYVAAFGSAAIGVFETAALRNNSFTPSPDQQIAIPGGGPAGLLLDEVSGLLYTLGRFENQVVVIDLDQRAVLQTQALDNPEPASVREGRRFLYDARLTSSRGDSSCAGCHIFGDLDLLAWDLGNPDEHEVENPNAYVDHPVAQIGRQTTFHPLKGPMTTQSLRGMAGNGPLHWRGDRPGRNPAPGESQEMAAFKEFNGAFVSLLGREAQLTDDQMSAFARFMLQAVYPPNPYRALDNGLTADQAAGRQTYLQAATTGAVMQCQTCHTLDPANGDFGTSGRMSIEGPDISQDMKVPHLRNMAVKVGMFGSGPKGSREASPFMGDQIAGFGFANDGAVDTLATFLSFDVFRFASTEARDQVVDFVLAFDSDYAPILGQQVTVSAGSSTAALDRARLLDARAAVTTPRPECDLVVHGLIDGQFRQALREPSGTFTTDRESDGDVTLSQLLQVARQGQNVLTFTCYPPGTGTLAFSPGT